MLNKNWKHVLPLALTTLVCMTSVARAENTTNSDSAHMRNLDNRVSALEQRKGAGGMINPQGRPQVRDGLDLFIYGNLLYWNAHENGLNYAVKESGDPIDLTAEIYTLSDASVNNLRGKWNWGFRAGIGYNTMHDGWDLRLTWLRFTDTGGNKPRTDSQTQFYATRGLGEKTESRTTADLYTQDARGYWGLNLNQIDLDLGREFFVSKWLTLRPHVGLRTDWIHQNVNAYYSLMTYESGRLSSTTKSAVLSKDHWWGMGLEGGLDTQWGLGGGWSIFGNMAGSILYGLHEITVKDAAVASDGSIENDTSKNLSQTYHISHPILDLQLGLRWDCMFYNDRFHLGLDLGWEHHVYFSQNQFPSHFKVQGGSGENPHGTFVANQGDLTTQGWTFAARFDF